MTDHEFLELAAKAAGINAEWQPGSGKALALPPSDPSGNLYWNPRDDDGDAFRLMVGLRLEPRYIDNSHGRGIEPSRVTMHNISGIAENIDGDPFAATRRAIVRAAAEIGKGMK